MVLNKILFSEISDFVCWRLTMIYVTILQHFIEHCSHHLQGKWARAKLYCNRFNL